MVCPVCEESLAHADEQATCAVLFGISDDPYRVCPRCFGEIWPEGGLYRDTDFRRRVRVYLFERHGIVVKESLWQTKK